MKKYSLLLFLLFFSLNPAFSQRTCGTMDHQNYLFETDQDAKQKHQEFEETLEEFKSIQRETAGGDVYTIPVVVHVVYHNASENISDAQIISQMDVLNEDYRFVNPDTGNVPAAFRPLVGDSKIEFCMATKDPQGNPSTGITRTYSNTMTFGINDEVKSPITGGVSPWPSNKYLNMWVCNLGGGLLGYAQFPNQNPMTDGVVMGYTYFGREGMVTAPYNGGRTTTHEVGHWLGLYHIWGDDGGACNGSDDVNDTPNQADRNFGCPSYPLTDNCTASEPGVMFMNYMDYVDDGCMNSFTFGQIERMRATLEGSRVDLLSSGNCEALELETNDALVMEIEEPVVRNCSGIQTITPMILLGNWGSDSLFSVEISYELDGGTPFTYLWTGTLASLENEWVELPSIPGGAGPHTFSATSQNPNAGIDGDPSNDNESISFNLGPALINPSAPIMDDFETGLFPANGWSIKNPDNEYTFIKYPLAGSDGGSSIYINNSDYDGVGEVDEVLLPILDFSSLTAPSLGFDYAYSLGDDPTKEDTFRVMVSLDCGSTWETKWEKFGMELVTSDPVSNSGFYSPADSHWVGVDVDLIDYASINGVQIKFSHTHVGGNNLYIDRVNLDNFVGIRSELSASNKLAIFPNPSHGEVFIMTAGDEIINEISVYDIQGVKQELGTIHNLGNTKLKLQTDNLSSGVYFVQVLTKGSLMTQKLIIK